MQCHDIKFPDTMTMCVRQFWGQWAVELSLTVQTIFLLLLFPNNSHVIGPSSSCLCSAFFAFSGNRNSIQAFYFSSFPFYHHASPSHLPAFISPLPPCPAPCCCLPAPPTTPHPMPHFMPAPPACLPHPALRLLQKAWEGTDRGKANFSLSPETGHFALFRKDELLSTSRTSSLSGTSQPLCLPASPLQPLSLSLPHSTWVAWDSEQHLTHMPSRALPFLTPCCCLPAPEHAWPMPAEYCLHLLFHLHTFPTPTHILHLFHSPLG